METITGQLLSCKFVEGAAFLNIAVDGHEPMCYWFVTPDVEWARGLEIGDITVTGEAMALKIGEHDITRLMFSRTNSDQPDPSVSSQAYVGQVVSS